MFNRQNLKYELFSCKMKRFHRHQELYFRTLKHIHKSFDILLTWHLFLHNTQLISNQNSCSYLNIYQKICLTDKI
jgi:hypothetical protein